MKTPVLKLRVLLPTRVALETDITRLRAEGGHGSFSVLPRHVDFCAALVPGILSFDDADGCEIFYAVDEGTVVKCGQRLLVSTRHAERGPDLGSLRAALNERLLQIDEGERQARTALPHRGRFRPPLHGNGIALGRYERGI